MRPNRNTVKQAIAMLALGSCFSACAQIFISAEPTQQFHPGTPVIAEEGGRLYVTRSVKYLDDNPNLDSDLPYVHYYIDLTLPNGEIKRIESNYASMYHQDEIIPPQYLDLSEAYANGRYTLTFGYEEHFSKQSGSSSFDFIKEEDLGSSNGDDTLCGPDGVCAGLGNGFYLPGTDLIGSPATNGKVILKNRKLGDGGCAVKTDIHTQEGHIAQFNSMSEFVENTSTTLSVSGSYASKTLSVKGTANAVTGKQSDFKETFHSASIDIPSIRHHVDLQDSSDCFSESNLDPKYLEEFEALAEIDPSKVYETAQWNDYITFLNNYGSHIMMQQKYGSRFMYWESSTSTASDVQKLIAAKACAEVEGESGDKGWSVNACGSYSDEEKRKAEQLSSTSKKYIKGGSKAARDALTLEITEQNLQNFLASADEATEAIDYQFKPVWELLHQIYSVKCKADDKTSIACKNLQRGVNLQAAYEGMLAIGCEVKNYGKNPQNTAINQMQAMRIDSTNSKGISTYQCWAKKVGCVNAGSCTRGVEACYCAGDSCIDKGEQTFGTIPSFKDVIRGTRHGGKYDGVNASCSIRDIFSGCDCDPNWTADGLGDRALYKQAI